MSSAATKQNLSPAAVEGGLDFPSDTTLLRAVIGAHSQDRINAYSCIIRKCSEKDVPDFKWSMLKKAELETLVDNLLLDLCPEQPIELLQDMVGIVGYISAIPEFTKSLEKTRINAIAEAVLNIAKKEKNKKIIIRVLWGFSMEKYPPYVYKKYCDEMVDIIIAALKNQDSSVVIYEALRLLQFLLKTVEAVAREKAVDFYDEVFPNLFHMSPKVRKVALGCTRALLEDPDCLVVLFGVIKQAVAKLKSSYCDAMLNMVNDGSVDGLVIWQACVKMLDKLLHDGTSLINALLPVVEKGFKSDSPIRVEAFICWRSLIDNFALERSVLLGSKRLRLLVAPFLANNAKNEEIATVKLNTWWHMICVLGPDAGQHFDMLVMPFLHFCFIANNMSSASPKGSLLAHKNLAKAGRNILGRVFSSLRSRLVFIFHHLLYGNLVKCAVTDVNLNTVSHAIVTRNIYLKHHELIHKCFREVIHYIVLGSDDTSTITRSIAEALMSLLGDFISNSSNVKEACEVVRHFFMVTSDQVAGAEEQMLVAERQAVALLEVISAAVSGKNSLSTTILCSHNYQCSAEGLMKGSLLSGLADLMLQSRLLVNLRSNRDRYMEVWRTVVNSYKLEGVSLLSFLQGIVASLSSFISDHADDKAGLLLDGDLSGSVAFAAEMWLCVVKMLRLSIEQSQIIDQGDSTEHDFSCVYSVLSLPIKHCSAVVKDLNKELTQQIIDEWRRLYEVFVNLTVLSPIAVANEEANYLAKQVLAVVRSEHLGGPPDLHCTSLVFLSNVLSTLASNFRYSELALLPAHNQSKALESPGVVRPAVLRQLQALVDACVEIWARVLRLVSLERCHAASALIRLLHHVFGGFKTPKLMVPLLTALLGTMTTLIQVNPAARYGNEVESQLLAEFEVFCTLLEEHLLPHSSFSAYSSDVRVLLQAGIGSTNKRVVSRVRRLALTMSRSNLPLPDCVVAFLEDGNYADAFDQSPGRTESRPALRSFLAKRGTPVSPGHPSPLQHSSAATSRSPGCRTPASAKKGQNVPHSRDALFDMKDDDFVRIASPSTNKRRVLTPHQKEKLMERRCDIPALYSDLSQQYSQQLTQDTGGGTGDNRPEKQDKSTMKLSSLCGRKSFSGSGIFPDMDGIEVMNDDDDDDEAARRADQSGGTGVSDVDKSRSSSADFSSVKTDEERESIIEASLEDIEDSPSQLSFAERIAKIKGCTTVVFKTGADVNISSLDDGKKTISSSKDDDSEDEIPDSQISEFALRRKSSLFSLSNCDATKSRGNSTAMVDTTVKVDEEKTCFANAKLQNEELVLATGTSKLESSLMFKTSDPELCTAEPTKSALCSTETKKLDSCSVTEATRLELCAGAAKRTPSKMRILHNDSETPTKVTRSGRKIVPPNKDMPQPMSSPSMPGRRQHGMKAAVESTSECDTSRDDVLHKTKNSGGVQRKISEMFTGESENLDSVFSTDDEISIKKNCDGAKPATYSKKRKLDVLNTSDEHFDNLLLNTEKILPSSDNIQSSCEATSKKTKNDLCDESAVVTTIISEVNVTNSYLVVSDINDAHILPKTSEPDSSVKGVSGSGPSAKETITEKSSTLEYSAIAQELRHLPTALEKENSSQSSVEPVSIDTADKNSVSSKYSNEEQLESSLEKLPSTLKATSTTRVRARRTSSLTRELASNLDGVKAINCLLDLDSKRSTRASRKNPNPVPEVKGIKRPRKTKKNEDNKVDFQESLDNISDTSLNKIDYTDENSFATNDISISSTTSSAEKTLLVNEASKSDGDVLKTCTLPDVIKLVTASPVASEPISYQPALTSSGNTQSDFTLTQTASASSGVTQPISTSSVVIKPEPRKRGRKRKRSNVREAAPAKRSHAHEGQDEVSEAPQLQTDPVQVRSDTLLITTLSDHGSTVVEVTENVTHEKTLSEVAVGEVQDKCDSAQAIELIFEESDQCTSKEQSFHVLGGNICLHRKEESASVTLKSADDEVEKLDKAGYREVESVILSTNTDEEPCVDEQIVEDSETSTNEKNVTTEGSVIQDINLLEGEHITESSITPVDSVSAHSSATPQPVLPAAAPESLMSNAGEVISVRERSDSVSSESSVFGGNGEGNCSGAVVCSSRLSLSSSDLSPSTGIVSERRKPLLSSSLKSGATSRAAMMVACAQRNRQKQGAHRRARLSLPPASDGRRSDLPVSPTRKSTRGSSESPVSTPPSALRRMRLMNVTPNNEQPWAKHLPSPAASPSSSILKMKRSLDSNNKGRRVSFADPPVSESVLIPNVSTTNQFYMPSPQNLKPSSLSMRAQKRLDMTKLVSVAQTRQECKKKVPSSEVSNLVKLVDPSSLPQPPSEQSLSLLVQPNGSSASDSESESDLENLSCSQGIYSSLAGCSEPVSVLLADLTASPVATTSLQAVLLSRGLSTVGHIASLTESDVLSLPIKTPKLEVLMQVLKTFEENSKRVVEDKTITCASSEESVAITNETNGSDKENESPAISPSTDSTKNLSEACKLVRNSFDATAVRCVLAEIPSGLDFEESDDDCHTDKPSCAAEVERQDSEVVTVCTSDAIVVEVPEIAVEIEESTDVQSVKDEIAGINICSGGSFSSSVMVSDDDQIYNMFVSLQNSGKKEALLSKIISSMSYKTVIRVFTDYLCSRE